MTYFQVNDQCDGCLACVSNCPANALKCEDKSKKRRLLHNMSLCARCGNCKRICPNDAIEFQFLLENRWDEFRELDLVRCRVCDKAIYTSQFLKTMTQKTGQKTKPLCSDHREEPVSLSEAHYLSTGRKGRQKGIEKDDCGGTQAN